MYNFAVTSFAGSVDWNSFAGNAKNGLYVTSFAGSVDWNIGVDLYGFVGLCHFLRGKCGLKLFRPGWWPPLLSHFLRGKCGLKFFTFWERRCRDGHFLRGKCGLKWHGIWKFGECIPSLPSREVWIEIVLVGKVVIQYNCHFLRGKCGLKFVFWSFFAPFPAVTSFAGSVDWNTACACDWQYW